MCIQRGGAILRKGLGGSAFHPGQGVVFTLVR